ncbi:hypothetical protein [Xanthomonas translucens]|nr:hypothetical protein [Xanthomonas translucens]UJB13663.1 hypothetical protein LTC53_11450 [Xanthomonas translucens pv. undulosa]UKE41161.1 hypothetical protein KCU58_08130 [Xanthomonas translucens pv. undulosa]UPU47955.1 hypothetical protein MZO50_14525 [Xanthomonas translucens pv. undulosa]
MKSPDFPGFFVSPEKSFNDDEYKRVELVLQSRCPGFVPTRGCSKLALTA